MKKKKIMLMIRANMILIQSADIIIDMSEIVCSQNIELCDDKNDSNNINEKYIDSNSCDSLDILAAVMKSWSKIKTNVKNKNKQIIQEHVKKKK